MIRVLFIILILFLSACSSVKNTLTNKKKSSSDEFLVEKKSPLVVPPDYGKLPKPIIDQNSKTKSDEKNKDEIKKMLTNKENISSDNNQSQSTSLEETILKKIK
tara:strand:+ start:463 stop:774 length:312 start_codon:yes stop_codon:yes gene_type:complete